MKILKLLEMPEFRDSLMSFFSVSYRMSLRSLERSFDELEQDEFPDQYGFFLRKDKKQAIVVKYEKSELEVRGKIVVELDFKDTLEIVWDGTPPHFNLPVLQVDGVVNFDEVSHSKGLVVGLYKLLAKQFVVISDNIHYQGGQAIWEKLAKDADGTSVLLCNNGEIVMDGEQPLRFDGGNYPKSEIWGNSTKLYFLLVLTNSVNNFLGAKNDE
jgi:hypothetical protein